MKRTVFLLLVLLCLSLTIPSIKAENETCQYWYSDASKVGHWFITPKVASEKLNNNSLFKFSQALSYARNQWTNAGVSTSSGNSIYTANIVVFGGTASEIYEECGIVINPYLSNGRTYYTSVSFFCYVNYQGSQKRVNEFEHIDVYILDNGRSENEYKNTA